MRLLLIEDNERLALLVKEALHRAGYNADWVSRRSVALGAIRRFDYALWLLDVGLPDGDGLKLLREVRGEGRHTACLILTARDAIHDRVDGLRAGADDYLTKPFAVAELIARIEALLRRPKTVNGPVIKFGNLSYLVGQRQFSAGGQAIAVSGGEREALECLMQAQGHRASRQRLEDYVYGIDQEVTPNALEVLVHRLRKRLRENGVEVTIKAERGFGYVLAHS